MSSISPEVGSFLIAAPTLADPNFKRSVVLLCEHNDEGSLGLVVNRPLSRTLTDVMPELFGESDQRFGELFNGGPVETGRMLALCRTDEPGSGYPVIDGLELVGAMEEALSGLAEGIRDAGEFRFFLGYSGWGPGQLENEIEEGSWILRPGTVSLAFETPPAQIWAESLRELGGVHRLIAEMPDDSSIN